MEKRRESKLLTGTRIGNWAIVLSDIVCVTINTASSRPSASYIRRHKVHFRFVFDDRKSTRFVPEKLCVALGTKIIASGGISRLPLLDYCWNLNTTIVTEDLWPHKRPFPFINLSTQDKFGDSYSRYFRPGQH
jgi:hypothetical protein